MFATFTSVRVCVPEIKTLYLRGNGCLVCVLYFTVYVYVCVQTNVCVPLYSTKGIDDVALNKK